MNEQGPFQVVRFQGNEYLLIGVKPGGLSRGVGAPLATKEQYENGHQSFAHLSENGFIQRRRVRIGSIEDLEPAGEMTVEVQPEALSNCFDWLEELLGDLLSEEDE